MSGKTDRQKVVVVGAGPVGALAALYAAERGDDVEIYELRAGMPIQFRIPTALLHFHVDCKPILRSYHVPRFVHAGKRDCDFEN